ncbi:hypothetical protein [Terrisporobacter mayombei]|uniref:Lipoprotein n=1 Tax=Terrisporobacter mayombei TaxID=1541 RepID=A0ABY9Q1F1_9FIRM|nr:hypothetical protein [Terrisporobacter mayombei]MCC3866640.1 hypothetical protein [Terrisporobacter mayombei]WMT80875.1 hypothetical protein TEMA_11970 [Terrisporobacter mayombei]
MKKYILLLSYVFVVTIFLVGCKSNNISDEITIDANYLNEQNVSGMGLDYYIKNINKGKYKISLYLKEFKKGEFLKEESLYNGTLDLDKNTNELNLSVYEENEKIKISIGESTFCEVDCDFFKTNSSGIALFGIEAKKKLTTKEESPIIGYIKGDKVKNIESANIDNIFNQNSNYELVIYLKINNVE